MFYLFKVLFTPSCWLQNHSYSADWDFDLRMLMQEHKFEMIDGYIVRLGGVIIWYQNHPYASFRPWNSIAHAHDDGKQHETEIRPRRVTMLEAMDKLNRDC